MQKVQKIAKELEADIAFNSLFEMHNVRSYMFEVETKAFNSLFEMRTQLHMCLYVARIYFQFSI